ncbi:Alcohol dehydrogenase [Moritella sp. JT01]|uniref:zinc-dependent alcohol dehydrogenase family protein n=1 Tax=Moritella sp. JT01 TaxID=756698 RepID=UPI00079AE457|nr:NAD(P)-dependent alcohol dehydrogenase [Moritella sp. JT01]KXO13229.1 Alcohol dehydrogenase [Moritella sp. JT01]
MKAWKIISDKNEFNIKQQTVHLRTPEHGEVCIRIRAASLNKRDLMIIKGTYPGVKTGELIPLSDGAGEIIALGEGVSDLRLGDRVVNLFWRDWIDGDLAPNNAAMGSTIHGVLAEEIILPAHALIKIPESLSFEEAATLPCAALTAWNSLMESGKLKPNQTVLTLGTGGVSLFTLQFAKAAGATVIITSSSNEKLARAKAMGADFIINYNTTPDWEEEVLRITEGEGAHFIIETGGPGTLSQSLKAASFNSQVTMIGVQAGVDEKISPLPILFKKIHLKGIMVGNRKMFENMLTQIATHKIKPVVDQIFDFNDAPKAFEAMESAKHFGKIVIVN